eukprot:CAMPEP_0170517940 /NCGR_PEP_ID=MMETSP0209-20121228/3751_1 /TAXON_ID=665100 ORGANISM="Litonotus pictus, Strain P1" /NCGR_SAMPLE_ID=MMETSP0209 /ASSEMBLY_ACC=CAM_ASM_000301 /LENGTH=217 /DNA_ID=CAMNT_0010803315 /DNA_START=132 /DNA_END=781 /DNA_ORIENTATION=-
MIVINGILARDAGSGIMDSTWVCGLDGVIYRWDPMNVVHNVLNQPPKCRRVDVDYEGLPWIITPSHQIWRLMHEYTENFRWVKLDGKGVDVGCSIMGDVFITGIGVGSFGFPIYRWNRATDNFCIVDGSGVRLDVAPNGALWTCNFYGNIFKRENNRYVQIDGIAWDLTCANSGDVYHRGNEYSIWKRISADWVRIDGYSMSLTAGDSLWVVRPDGV